MTAFAAPTNILPAKVAACYEKGAAVTVSDTVQDPNGPFSALWVGAAGTVKLQTRNNDTLTLVGVPAGTLLPIACQAVWSTGTTVATPNTNIVGLA